MKGLRIDSYILSLRVLHNQKQKNPACEPTELDQHLTPKNKRQPVYTNMALDVVTI